MANQGNQGYIRFPTIHGDVIVFTAEDDLWRVAASGGRAERLTAGVAEATHACFSPDGRRLAFTGRDEGPAEVYVMPAEGGAARRLTYQGEQWANVAAWRPDGTAIVYASPAGQPMVGGMILWEVAPGGGGATEGASGGAKSAENGGEPRPWPYGPARNIAFGPQGALVLGRHTVDPARWKRYRGGTAGYLWIDAQGDGEFRRLLTLDSNIGWPCWMGERIYFISDHEGIGNVYSCLSSGEDLRRHTDQTEYYARGLSSDGARLVYHAGGDLYLLDPQSNAAVRLDVTLPSTRAQRARKFVPAADYLSSWAPHPRGHSLAVTTRGKAFSLGDWDGAVVQHGAMDGTRYRLLAWLADGKRLVAVADAGAEPRLVVFSGNGNADEKALDALDIGHVIELRPAPVGAQVALVNHRCEVLVADVDSGRMRVLDRSPYGRTELAGLMRGLAWSPDAAWLAYAFPVNGQQTIIKLCRVATGETYDVTEPVRHDAAPAFDPAGRYLYFISGRDFDPTVSALHFEYSFPMGQRPYLVTLRRDLRSPFQPAPEAPKSELEELLAKAQQAQKAHAGTGAPGAQRQVDGAVPEAAPEPVAIDLEGISGRIVAFPVPEGRYGRVQGTRDGVLFSSFPVTGSRKEPWPTTTPVANGALGLYSFDTHQQEHIADGISDFELTADGETLLYRAGNRLRVLNAGERLLARSAMQLGGGGLPGARDGATDRSAEKPGRESGWVDLNRIKVSVRPDAEWKQMFDEAWRLQREQFWVADMGGVDWQRAHDRYAPLVERVASRAELSDLFWELQGELGSSHAYEIGGEYRPRPQYQQGYLGVDYDFDAAGRYRIARLLRGDPWDAETTSPLLGPGVNVQVGDAIVAINGQRLGAERSPQQLLVHQMGSEVLVTIAPADGGPERSMTVKTLSSERPARYRDWVETNRRKVREATQGRVGYVHIPDMGSNGYAEFHRAYLAEYDHDGLIVDVRYNGGGIVSPLLLEKLARPRLGYSFQRWGVPEPYFYESPRGPLVALTNENAGSDGDIFSHAWKMLKLGPLIGKRTWGGVIGIEPYIPLADGTFTTQPEFSFYFSDVAWGVENYGTNPTIEVDNPPQAYAAGRDPQLERGIAEALRLLAERTTATPTPPRRPDRAAPIRSRQGS
jgi:tricorn protease